MCCLSVPEQSGRKLLVKGREGWEGWGGMGCTELASARTLDSWSILGMERRSVLAMVGLLPGT